MTGARRSLVVERTGPLALLTGLGRPGLAGLGVPPGGALDPASLRLANRLVGNPEDAPGLEVTLGGLVLRARGTAVVAAAGAPVLLVVTSGGARRPVAAGASVVVPDGATLEVQAPPAGLRSWLAVRGGLPTPPLLTAPVRDGAELAVGPVPATPVPAVDHAPRPAPDAGPVVLRVVPGPRDDWFVDGVAALVSRRWSVDPRSDRVGLRLDGEPLARAAAYDGRELASEGMVAGSLQVPPSGLPVLLLADHPVTGGYPVVATVLRDDLPLAAQAVPGAAVAFRAVTGPALP